MKQIFCFFLLIIAVFFEATLIQLPFVLLVLLIITVIYQEEWIFPLGLICGLLLDSLTFHALGSSSSFFTIFLFIIFLYEKKFELRSIWFVIIMSFVGSLLFLYFYGHDNLLNQLIFSPAIGIILFFIFSKINPLPPKDALRTWKR